MWKRLTKLLRPTETFEPRGYPWMRVLHPRLSRVAQEFNCTVVWERDHFRVQYWPPKVGINSEQLRECFYKDDVKGIDKVLKHACHAAGSPKPGAEPEPEAA